MMERNGDVGMMRHYRDGMVFSWECPSYMEQERRCHEAMQQLQSHLGHFVVLQHADNHTTLLLLIKIEYRQRYDRTDEKWPKYSIPAPSVDLIGYEDGELTIDGPITVPLSDVVDWVGEDN